MYVEDYKNWRKLSDTKIGKRTVILKQGGGEGSRKNTVDVQVKEGDASTRRNTIDLQFREGRSRKNTLDLKINGESVSTGELQDMAPPASSPRVPRNHSVRSPTRNSSSTNEQQQQRIDNSQGWPIFNPSRQFILLKTIFIIMCLVDIMHWAYLLRDDSEDNPNSWVFYRRFQSFDLYYLVARMFGDIFVCVLGLGAAMWTRKPLLTLPCTTIQLLLLLIRVVAWTVRSWNGTLARLHATNEDKFFVVCEMVLPSIWVLLSVLIVRTMKKLRSYEQLHGYAHPPVIVLTVKNDENDESVQIEIA